MALAASLTRSAPSARTPRLAAAQPRCGGRVPLARPGGCAAAMPRWVARAQPEPVSAAAAAAAAAAAKSFLLCLFVSLACCVLCCLIVWCTNLVTLSCALVETCCVLRFACSRGVVPLLCVRCC